MRKAFSLIELMIVLVIVGVIYTLVITKLQNYSAHLNTTLTLKTLKPILADLAQAEEQSVTLWCFDGCEECAIYKKGKKIKDVPELFTSQPQVYRYDFAMGFIPAKFLSFFDANGVQKDVCFAFSVDKQGIADQIIMEYDDTVYDYTNYFQPVQTYQTLEDAQAYKEQQVNKVMQ